MTKILEDDDASIEEAAQLIKAAEVVAFPTETVYGLGALEKGIHKIYEIKGRDRNKPLALLISSIDQVKTVATDIPKSFFVLAEKFFPGPLTIVLKKRGEGTIAVRMPDHPLALKLIENVGEPIFATSANLSGNPSIFEPQEVLQQFNGKIGGVIMGGKCKLGIASTVISLVGDQPKLLRAGSITNDLLNAIVN